MRRQRTHVLLVLFLFSGGKSFGAEPDVPASTEAAAEKVKDSKTTATTPESPVEIKNGASAAAAEVKNAVTPSTEGASDLPQIPISGVSPQTAKKFAPPVDPDWSWASGLVKKHLGPTTNNPPKHLEPYELEKRHSSKELKPPYEVNMDDFKPTASRSLEHLKESVNLLKDNVFQAKARVYEWGQEEKQRTQRSVANTLEKQFAHVSVAHLDRMSSLYSLVSLTYYLDGQKVYSYLRDPGRDVATVSDLLSLKEKESLKVFEGMIPAGKHSLTIHAIYQGNGDGVFKYLDDYRVRVVDEKAFSTSAGERYGMTVTSYEKGRFYTSFRERPAFQLDMVVRK